MVGGGETHVENGRRTDGGAGGTTIQNCVKSSIVHSLVVRLQLNGLSDPVSLLSERFRLNCRIDDLPDYQIMISTESARSHSNACEHKFALIDVLILYDVSIIICIDPPTGLR
jgi:hypothetical protein